MSATAKLLKDAGVAITGSDEAVYPPISTMLEREALVYKTPYAAENIPADADVIVIGKNAKLTPELNPEVAAAFASGKRMMSFPEVLAEVSLGKKNIVVAGSYGKSTSAALLAHCLETAAKDPSYLIGAVPLSPASAARMGNGELFVLEGDEYPSSNTDPRSKFLHMHPAHLLITPLAHDHFNVFPTPAEYLAPFFELVTLPPAGGHVVVCMDGSLSKEFLAKLSRPSITYGLSKGEFTAANIVWGERTSFDICRNGNAVVRVTTSQLGEHNVENIVGVAAFLLSADLVTTEEFAAAVVSFKGIVRRLDRKSEKTSIPIFEGFGSSYEKAKSAIAAMKLHFPTRDLVIVFEPYTINWRKKETLSQYEDVFAGAARALVIEPPLHGKGMEISVEDIAQRVRTSVPEAQGYKNAQEVLANLNLQKNDAVLLLSSGAMDGLIETIPAAAEHAFPL